MHSITKKNILDSIFIELQDVDYDMILNMNDDFYNNEHIPWDPISSFRKNVVQTEESYQEQLCTIKKIKMQ